MRLILTLVVSLFLSFPAIAQETALKTRLAVDGQGNAIRDAVIVVRDGRIVSVQPNGRIPQGEREIDLTKFTVMPGLIDMLILRALDKLATERISGLTIAHDVHSGSRCRQHALRHMIAV